MKEFKQLGSYGLVIKNEKILLIKKHGGPYDGKLDLPGGSIEFRETPKDALIRELKEEVGIYVKKYELFDADSVNFNWTYNNEEIIGHHVGIFFKVIEYENEIKSNMKLDDHNNDSLGAKFYKINSLKKEDLSLIAIMELEKLGYSLN